jgi:hypothetical protein
MHISCFVYIVIIHVAVWLQVCCTVYSQNQSGSELHVEESQSKHHRKGWFVCISYIISKSMIVWRLCIYIIRCVIAHNRQMYAIEIEVPYLLE